MLRLTKKADYGLMALKFLAEHPDSASLSAKDIAEAYHIPPQLLAKILQRLAKCKTLLWNGPVGAFEIPPFGEGTFRLAREAARLTRAGQLVTVAGGGDTVAALNAAGVTKQFTYVSTAGGAFLEWLEGRTLPGVAALTRS